MSGTPDCRQRGRGGQGGHESHARVRTRELRAWELAVAGSSQHAIADDLGISQAAVSKLLKRVELRTLREMSEAVAREKARHSVRLELLFREIRTAYSSDATGSRYKAHGRRSDFGAFGLTSPWVYEDIGWSKPQ